MYTRTFGKPFWSTRAEIFWRLRTRWSLDVDFAQKQVTMIISDSAFSRSGNTERKISSPDPTVKELVAEVVISEPGSL